MSQACCSSQGVFSTKNSRPPNTRNSSSPSSSKFSLLSLPFLLFTLLLLLSQTQPASAIKFQLQAARNPSAKCIWNAVHENQLVIVTAHTGPGNDQRIDIDIVDSSDRKNVYLSKKDIRGETRLAITTHAEGQLGVCLKNTLARGVVYTGNANQSRVIELDVDIGADAVDWNAIANQESLSALETEMRKLEGLVNEIVEDYAHLKKREQRFTDTNESTNSRVTNFGAFTFFALVALGIWQIVHLRSFFKRKYLID